MTIGRFDTPSAVVIGPDEGESLWQPLPSRGYVTVNLTPANTPYDDFSSGIQVLPPGCSVRDHGHRQNHELIFVYEGRGRCTIEDRTYDAVPGTTILFGRHAVHRLENTGDVDMKLFWVFFPPGLEDWFRAIGRPRTPGQPMPDAFPRPEHVREVQERMRFVVPQASVAADAAARAAALGAAGASPAGDPATGPTKELR